MKLQIEYLKLDPEIQSRAQNDEATVREYAEAMADGAVFPPIVVYREGETFRVADGFHRALAAKEAGWKEIEAEVREGAARDAMLHAVGANATHGLRRTNADKRKAVETLLQDKEWSKWSNREIAKKCAVSHEFVGKVWADVIRQSAASGAGPLSTVDSGFEGPRLRKCADGRVIDTSNIGKGGASKPREMQPVDLQKAGQDGKEGTAAPPDGAPESALDDDPNGIPMRKADEDTTCIVAEFGSKEGQGGNGLVAPLALRNAMAMTPEETIRYLQDGLVPDRPEIVMKASELLRVLISFAEQDGPQKEMKVIVAGKNGGEPA